MADLRVGFVGAGIIAKAHAIALNRIEGVTITAAIDPLKDRAEELVAEFGGKAFTSFDDAADEVDAVWVGTPPYLHCENSLAALEAGKHVFVEKPIALSLADADAMIEVADRGNLKLAVGEMIRFYPAYREMRRIIDAGEIGDLVSVWSHRYSNSSLDFDPQWRWDPKKSGGFVFEWQTHEINTIRYLGGEVVSVDASVYYSPKLPEYDVTAYASLVFENGSTGRVDGSVQFPYSFVERGALGTEGAVIARDDETLMIHRLDSAAPEVYRGIIGIHEGEHGRTTLRRVLEDRDFVAAIRDDRQPSMNGREGRADIEVALAIHESSREGRTVKLSPGAG
ncbi:MAG: Gfo/Idh/MocA family oxidoreductase [Chloroflexi bacterium]|nr:Gfo/Idh/MocA family oxidoreductase [Chloroflexota bacterium]MCY3938357.1 Gfo/Idh/MocA family oxidoreductase [Chloroflexota bacterium]